MPFLNIQRALEVSFFFYKVTVPFFVPGVNTNLEHLHQLISTDAIFLLFEHLLTEIVEVQKSNIHVRRFNPDQ